MENSSNSIPNEIFKITKEGLFSGSAIKFFALLIMTIDHVGLILYPIISFDVYVICRTIGRLAMPLFAYMIAEGARYTRNKLKYIGLMSGIASASFLFMGLVFNNYYVNIFGTFTFSLILIFLYQFIVDNYKKYIETKDKKFAYKSAGLLAIFVAVLAVMAVVFLYYPTFKDNKLLGLDYGFFGVLLPLSAYIFKNKVARIALFSVTLLAMAWEISLIMGAMQYLCLLTIPILILYNGKRGKVAFKYGFYLYYPIHLGIFELILILVQSYA